VDSVDCRKGKTSAMYSVAPAINKS